MKHYFRGFSLEESLGNIAKTTQNSSNELFAFSDEACFPTLQ
jgi:hypothetical protein